MSKNKMSIKKSASDLSEEWFIVEKPGNCWNFIIFLLEPQNGDIRTLSVT